MGLLRSILGRAPQLEPRQRLTLPGSGAFYAIGDVHGCLDLLELLEAKIADDAAAISLPATTIVLGDIVDRGPRSAQTIDHVIERQHRGDRLICLLGNHEMSMLEYLRHPDPASPWLRQGGLETLLSYGVDAAQFARRKSARQAITALIPDEHIGFLQCLPIAIETPNWFFSHAGVREGRTLTGQSEHDLIWHKDNMASSYADREKIIVHGHDAIPEAFVGTHRINVDTGAFATGRLTAVRLVEGRAPFTLSSQRSAVAAIL
jgi:serine/threonine protein phosphatase 1